MSDEMVRLNKYLKDCNLCSRRKADEFIAKGYVKVNDQVVTELGFKINPKLDKVDISEKLNQETEKFSYILLNKPKGYVCSKSLSDGKNIFMLLPRIDDLTYAGRLDKDSHGLVILSNDGRFVYKVMGAEFNLEKEYIVKVDKPITPNFLASQSNGNIMLDGKLVRRARTKQINPDTYKITLTEGINRQIRRMAENQGYSVLDLKRISIGTVTDPNLKLGCWRNLNLAEIKQLNNYDEKEGR